MYACMHMRKHEDLLPYLFYGEEDNDIYLIVNLNLPLYVPSSFHLSPLDPILGRALEKLSYSVKTHGWILCIFRISKAWNALELGKKKEANL